jgi:preprotein translocase subunit SecG
VLTTILVIVWTIACLFLILVVLLQAGKGGGLGALAGGGTQVFGGRGAATFLTKLTGIMAATFMILSIAISLNLTGERASVSPETNLEQEDLSAVDEEAAPEAVQAEPEAAAPAAPEAVQAEPEAAAPAAPEAVQAEPEAAAPAAPEAAPAEPAKGE